MTGASGGRPQIVFPDTGLGVPVALTTRHALRAGVAASEPFDIGGTTAGAAAADARARVRARLGLAEVRWLDQVHGTRVLDDAAWAAGPPGPADAQWTARCATGVAVQVADCVPVVLARADRSAVAVAHAGWRGLAAGVLDATLAGLGSGGGARAWVGPAICARHYEVGEEVAAALAALDVVLPAAVMHRGRPGRWQLDMAAAARVVLAARGVDVRGGGTCNRCEGARWYSHRGRAETGAGRFAAVAWLPAVRVPDRA